MAMANVVVGAVPAAEWAPKSPKKSAAFPKTSVMLIIQLNGVAVAVATGSDANVDVVVVVVVVVIGSSRNE
jgi:hypothetical protein